MSWDREREMEKLRAGLADSPYTREWTGSLRNLCHKGQAPPVACDCGFVGDWNHRWVWVWYPDAGLKMTDRLARQWIAWGLPHREGGYWVAGGFDERCPGCGDIERFDLDANRVRTFTEPAKVVVFMDAHR